MYKSLHDSNDSAQNYDRMRQEIDSLQLATSLGVVPGSRLQRYIDQSRHSWPAPAARHVETSASN